MPTITAATQRCAGLGSHCILGTSRCCRPRQDRISGGSTRQMSQTSPLFHPASECLFVGDHLYISKHLEDELVGPGKEAREQEMREVAAWAADKGERIRWRFNAWATMLRELQRLPARYLCPGHGGVLEGEVQEFLATLAAGGAVPTA